MRPFALCSTAMAAPTTPLDQMLAVWCSLTQGSDQPAAGFHTDEADQRDIHASQQGDPEAYARLIRRHQEQVGKRMWRFTRNRTEYEELVHEVFVEAYFSLSRYREISAFPAWLNRITTRVGYRFWKRNRRANQTVGLENWDGVDADGSGNMAAQEAADRLHSLLAQLKPRDRLVLTLLYWDGCSVTEAAEQTGWTKTMVKVQAYRARARLKKMLEQA